MPLASASLKEAYNGSERRLQTSTKRLGAGTSSHPHYTHSTNSDQVADTSLETHICGNILWSRQEMLPFWATQASLSDAQANSTQGSTRVGVNRCLDAQHPQNCISLLSQKFFSTTRCAPYFCSRCCRWQAISWKSREVLTVVFFFSPVVWNAYYQSCLATCAGSLTPHMGLHGENLLKSSIGYICWAGQPTQVTMEGHFRAAGSWWTPQGRLWGANLCLFAQTQTPSGRMSRTRKCF